MDSESLNNELEHNATGYRFASSALCLASFKLPSAESLGLMHDLIVGRFKTFAVRGRGT